ncbi:hypothetical protein BSKO_09289 [Bryopsis sp. KO-2023]|nr:hypothetical protein BSKO_09289 [Bryopsis sp. KO-2023]
MGKNQAYKQMQRAKHAASADGHFHDADDGTIDASFHTPEWHAARVASLQVQRLPWEEWKKKVKEEEDAKEKLEEDEERVMREYRAQLDADREKRMGKSQPSQPSASESKTKKRKRTDKDREKEKDKEKKKSKKHKKDKKQKKRKKHKKRSRSIDSSVTSTPSESSSDGGGPIRLSEYLK